jgi:hypothetical protein
MVADTLYPIKNEPTEFPIDLDRLKKTFKNE